MFQRQQYREAAETFLERLDQARQVRKGARRAVASRPVARGTQGEGCRLRDAGRSVPQVPARVREREAGGRAGTEACRLHLEPISADEAAGLFGLLSDFSPLVLLAVSGGPDSTALMWLAARWRDGLEHPPKLIAATIDHGLRKESAREARAVKAVAKTLEIEHVTLRWAGKKPKTGIEEAARQMHAHRLLGELVRASGGRHLLTAHTLDDQAETILFRMARGSGVSGLSGMNSLDGVPVRRKVPA